MNIKDTINFKTLREKGPSSIEIKDDEAIQLVGKGAEIKVVITQDHYLQLLSAHHQLLIRSGKRSEEAISIEDRLQSFEEKLSKIIKVTEEEDKKWKNGQKMAGNY